MINLLEQEQRPSHYMKTNSITKWMSAHRPSSRRLASWNADDLAAGCYQAVLDRMDIPGAARIMDVALIVAVDSWLHSVVSTASRRVFLAGRARRPNGNGKYGFNLGKSPLDPKLPAEATFPPCAGR